MNLKIQNITQLSKTIAAQLLCNCVSLLNVWLLLWYDKTPQNTEKILLSNFCELAQFYQARIHQEHLFSLPFRFEIALFNFSLYFCGIFSILFIWSLRNQTSEFS